MSDKPALEFIDINILIYAHDHSAGEKHTTARDLIRGLWETGNGCIVHEEFGIAQLQNPHGMRKIRPTQKENEDLE